MIKKSFSFLFIAFICLLAFSCKKEPGPGGKSTVYGKVFVKDYNSTFTILEQSFYGPDIWVYIVYGDDRDYGDRIKTGIDGSYEFKYLRPGTYHVYTFSKDSTLQTLAPLPVVRDVEVPKKKQEIQVPDITIFI
jgi:hypothetical protein